MINKKNFSLPYPALGLPGDFNEGGFIVKPQIYTSDNELHIKEQGIEISNKYIQKLYLDGMITTAYKVVCPSTLYSYSSFKNKHIIIDMDLISSSLNLEVFLVAEQDIESYSDESFNDDYFLGDNNGVFEIEKGNIVGFVGSKKIPLKEIYVGGASGIFKFSRTNDEEIPLAVNTEDNKIEITYPYEGGQLDLINTMPRNFKITFLNLFIIPALQEAFKDLNDDEELIDKYDWAYILSEGMPDYQNHSPFSSAQLYLKKLLSSGKKNSKIPVLEAFYKELTSR